MTSSPRKLLVISHQHLHMMKTYESFYIKDLNLLIQNTNGKLNETVYYFRLKAGPDWPNQLLKSINRQLRLEQPMKCAETNETS